MIERIDAVGIGELGQLAGELFAVDRLSVAGVGPEQDAFREAIEPLGGAVAAGPDRSDGAPEHATTREAV